MSEVIQNRLKVIGSIIVVVAGLWAGFGLLYGLKMEVDRLGTIVSRLDSTVAKNDAWRKKQVCKANGYTAELLEKCPLLKKTFGEEEIEPPGEAATLPEIEP